MKDDSVVSGGADGAMHIWNAQQQKTQTTQFNAAIMSIAVLSFDVIAISTADGEISSWNRETKAVQTVLMNPYGYTKGELIALSWLSASNALAIASNTGALTLWDIHSHSTIASTNFPGLIHAMAAAPTGRTLAVSVELQPQQSEGTEESAATEATAKERKHQGARSAIGGHRSTAGAVPSSGRPAAARTEAKEAEAAVGPAVMLLEGATLQQLQRLPLTSDHATALAWNSDGSSLAVGSNDGGITIWRRSDSGGNGTGNGGSAAFVPVLESVKGEGKGVAHLAWSVDGKLLCSGDAHGEVRYWRAAAGISAAAAEASEGKRHPGVPVASGESLSLLYREEYATEDNGAPSSQLEEVDAGGAGSGGEGREGSSEVWEAHWLDGAGGLGRVARDALLRLWYGEEGRGGLVLSGMQKRSEDGGGAETEVGFLTCFALLLVAYIVVDDVPTPSISIFFVYPWCRKAPHLLPSHPFPAMEPCSSGMKMR